MLSEIAAEALRFLSRRDLDKACAVSKWFDALITECCDLYPFRSVALVNLYPRESVYELDLRIQDGTDSHQYRSFASMDEAVRFTGSILRHSFVDRFWMGAAYYGSMTLRPEHWTTLMEAFRRSSIGRLRFERVDFSALDDDAFLVAVGFRGLQSLDVHESVVRSGFVTDDLLRASLTKGLVRLRLSDNNTDAPHSISENLVLDVCFPADVAPGGLPRNIQLEGTGVTGTFLTKFIECVIHDVVHVDDITGRRIKSDEIQPKKTFRAFCELNAWLFRSSPLIMCARASSLRPSGSLKFYDAPKQRGLSVYARFLTPGPLPWMETIYRFPSVDHGNESYEVTFRERSSYVLVKFCTVRRSS